MKRTSLVLLLTVLLTAHLPPAPAQQINQSSLHSLKTKLRSISNDGLSILTQSKSCFDKVNNEASFNQCVSAVPDKLKPDLLNLFSTSNNVLNLKSESEKQLSYSQNNNQKIIDYLDTSINSISTMLTCIDHSNDSNQLLSCIDRKKTQTKRQQTSNASNQATGNLSEDW